MFHDVVLECKNFQRDALYYAHHKDMRDRMTEQQNHYLDMCELLLIGSQFVMESKPHIFYMDRNHIDQNIVDTGHEFYREGILKFPFDECMFIFDNAIEEDHPQLTKNKREAYLIRKRTAIKNEYFKKQIQIDNVHDGSEFDYVHMKFTEIQGDEGIDAFPDPFLYFVANNKTHGEYGGIALKPLLPLPKLEHMDKEMIEANSRNSISTIIGALMLLNTKYIDKKSTSIDPKLNQRRVKNGKQPLLNYTVVKLKESYASGNYTATGHASPKPHWRRGHIRRLADKVVPVQPCMVNFEGDEIVPKTYKVQA